MEERISLLIEAQDKSYSRRREEFLKELDIRYGFGGLSSALSAVRVREVKGSPLKENKRISKWVSDHVLPRV